MCISVHLKGNWGFSFAYWVHENLKSCLYCNLSITPYLFLSFSSSSIAPLFFCILCPIRTLFFFSFSLLFTLSSQLFLQVPFQFIKFLSSCSLPLSVYLYLILNPRVIIAIYLSVHNSLIHCIGCICSIVCPIPRLIYGQMLLGYSDCFHRMWGPLWPLWSLCCVTLILALGFVFIGYFITMLLFFGLLASYENDLCL